MPNRAWLERLVLFLVAHAGKPVVVTSRTGTHLIRDVRDDGDRITIHIQDDQQGRKT